MTSQQFQEANGAQLKLFLEGKLGQEFMQTLGSLRPGYEFPKEDHLLLENRGALRGYELCMRNIVFLCFVKNIPKEPEINYGVTEKTV